MNRRPSPSKGFSERLDRQLSKRGMLSRTAARAWIERGWVKVNGTIIRSADWRCTDRDAIELLHTDTRKRITPLSADESNQYLLYHKPKGEITTVSDPNGRRTVFASLKAFLHNTLPDEAEQLAAHLKPVGRLDKDSTGLLLFTSDSQFGNWILSPESEIPKTYFVRLNRPLIPQHCEQLMQGVELVIRQERYFARAAGLRLLTGFTCEITLTEGKNREVRRLFSALDYRVEELKRVALGRARIETQWHEGRTHYIFNDEAFPLGAFRWIGKNDL